MTTVVLIGLIVLLLAALAAVLARRAPRNRRIPVTSTRRILFPFQANALSPSALDAALRLARAEEATIVPVFLARVSLHLPLDTPLPRQCEVGIALLEAIEQRAAAFGVPVDTRIERGRSYRHALRRTIAAERFDRIVIAAAETGNPGFDADHVAWLLDHAPGEIVVLRASKDERLISPPAERSARGRTRRERPRRSPPARALG